MSKRFTVIEEIFLLGYVLLLILFSSSYLHNQREHFLTTLSQASPNNELTRKMKIRAQWGSTWEVEICRNPRFYFMEKSGWERFVRDNALGDHEFLTFNHRGEMRFTVNIFKQDDKEMLQPPQSMTFLASSSRIKTEQGRCSNLSPTTAAESNGGGNYERKLNFGKRKAKESQNSKRTKNVINVRRDSSGASSSSVAEFTIFINQSYLIFLRFPKSVQKNHMPEQRTIFKIHHLNMKKSWNVVYLVSETDACFSGVWKRLAHEYPLAVGDTCKFTFLKPEELILVVSKPP